MVEISGNATTLTVDETWTFKINYGVAPPTEGFGLLLLAGAALYALSKKEERRGYR